MIRLPGLLRRQGQDKMGRRYGGIERKQKVVVGVRKKEDLGTGFGRCLIFAEGVIFF